MRVMRCDESDESSVMSMLSSVRSIEGWESDIEGIELAAGVSDHYSSSLVCYVKVVWDAKAHSVWVLHKHTSQDNLRIFVCYSIIAAAIGPNVMYSSANEYFDGLVEMRCKLGLCGVSIRWPAVSGVGMAAMISDKTMLLQSILPSDVENVLTDVIQRSSRTRRLALEGKIAEKKLSGIFVSADLRKCESFRSVSVGILDITSCRSRLSGVFGCKLLTSSFATGRITSSLFVTCHSREFCLNI